MKSESRCQGCANRSAFIWKAELKVVTKQILIARFVLQGDINDFAVEEFILMFSVGDKWLLLDCLIYA